jgi:hypothetical protein
MTSTTILLDILLVVIALGFIISMRPGNFGVTRSASMQAAPAKIFAQVNNLRAWEAWSPWAKLDPNAKTTFEGPPAGVGAVMRWAGNMQVGAGSMTITESRPNDLVRFRLDFLKPMKAVNTAEFTFTPQGNQTLVTWSMTGKNNFVGKAMGLFMNCEKIIGGNFEQGLASMKTVVEGK